MNRPAPATYNATRTATRGIKRSTPTAPAVDAAVAEVPQLDGETLRLANAEQGYRYRQQQRYLEEDDRVEIIRRIAGGEKQSDLAREFQVTRAAICNTYKNRDEILSRSRGLYEAQCAKEAKPAMLDNTDVPTSPIGQPSAKRRRCASPTSPRRGCATASDKGSPTRISRSALVCKSISPVCREMRHETPTLRWANQINHQQLIDNVMPKSTNRSLIRVLRSRPAEQLVMRLRDNKASAYNFRLFSNRLVRLLLEEAVAVALAASLMSLQPNDDIVDPVAIAIGEGGYPLARSFQEMVPESAVGHVRFDRSNVQTHMKRHQISLPTNAQSVPILLLDCECFSGRSACDAIQALVQCGIPEDSIHFVSIFGTVTGLGEIAQRFPDVKGLVASIDQDVQSDRGGNLTPWSGGFLDRYYQSDVLLN